MVASPGWATSSDGEAADTKPTDLAALGEHKTQCSATNGRWVALRCAASHGLALASSRLVTTVAVLAAIAGLVLSWL